jgi:hypothetical protein
LADALCSFRLGVGRILSLLDLSLIDASSAYVLCYGHFQTYLQNLLEDRFHSVTVKPVLHSFTHSHTHSPLIVRVLTRVRPRFHVKILVDERKRVMAREAARKGRAADMGNDEHVAVVVREALASLSVDERDALVAELWRWFDLVTDNLPPTLSATLQTIHKFETGGAAAKVNDSDDDAAVGLSTDLLYGIRTVLEHGDPQRSFAASGLLEKWRETLHGVARGRPAWAAAIERSVERCQGARSGAEVLLDKQDVEMLVSILQTAADKVMV